MSSSLCEICSEIEGYKPRDYWSFYEGLFFRKKNLSINLLEIGVESGSSLKIWKKYFVNYNKIVGIDINETEKIEGVDIVHGDATEKSIFDKYSFTTYDFIIDDGSHKGHDMVASFELFYPLLDKGGVYIIEDVRQSKEKYLFSSDLINNNNPLVINWRGRDCKRGRGVYQALMLFNNHG